MSQQLDIHTDEQARAWLDAHADASYWVVDYETHRCCGGGKICEVSVRASTRRPEGYLDASLADGTRFAIDPRAARRLPASFGLTVRGIGPLKHLDLVLSGDEWGELLYT